MTTGGERRRTRMHGWQGEPESHRLQPPGAEIRLVRQRRGRSALAYFFDLHLPTHRPDYDVARVGLSAQSTHADPAHSCPSYGTAGAHRQVPASRTRVSANRSDSRRFTVENQREQICFVSSRKVSGLPEKPGGLYSRGPFSALHTKPLNRARRRMAARIRYLPTSSNAGNSFMLKFDTTTTAAPSGAIAG